MEIESGGFNFYISQSGETSRIPDVEIRVLDYIQSTESSVKYSVKYSQLT
jgi:hypothetical protein